MRIIYFNTSFRSMSQHLSSKRNYSGAVLRTRATAPFHPQLEQHIQQVLASGSTEVLTTRMGNSRCATSCPALTVWP